MKHFTEAYNKKRSSLYQQIVNGDVGRETQFISLDPETLKRRDYGDRRRGRPKKDWATNAAIDYWELTKELRKEPQKSQELDLDNQLHVDIIKDLSSRQVLKGGNKKEAPREEREEQSRTEGDSQIRREPERAVPVRAATHEHRRARGLTADPREWLCS